MTNILISWIGETDLRVAQENQTATGIGPIAQAITNTDYSAIILVSDYPKERTDPFLDWLQPQTSTKIIFRQEQLSSPTDYQDIHRAASKAIECAIKKFGKSVDLTFHLSPGTPAMAAVWLLLSKTRFPAKLIESSKAHGVRPVSIPFDISADFIPNVFRQQDNTIERLAAGLPATAPEFDDITHRSEVMQRLVLRARRVALRSIPVLIEGESGTGKELFARAIHEASPRKGKSFIAINCGAIPADLVESELFGYEKGAFTGANAIRIGHFEAADKGTIFLDEIGELPKNIQVKLLRTVQENEVKRIGATEPRKIDIRIVAATNRTLIEEVAAGSFREDLFYRLAVAVIKLPPLRERKGDVSLLVEHFLKQINQESKGEPGYKHKDISVSARNVLLKHSWPGNIRELQNTLTRAMVWSVDEELNEADIRDSLLPIPAAINAKEDIMNQPLGEGFNLQELIKKVGTTYLKKALDETHGNKTKAAEILGLSSYQTLNNWLKKHNLE